MVRLAPLEALSPGLAAGWPLPVATAALSPAFGAAEGAVLDGTALKIKVRSSEWGVTGVRAGGGGGGGGWVRLGLLVWGEWGAVEGGGVGYESVILYKVNFQGSAVSSTNFGWHIRMLRDI